MLIIASYFILKGLLMLLDFLVADDGLLGGLQLDNLLGTVGHLVGTVSTVADVVVDDVANLALSVDHILDSVTSVATTAITADLVNLLVVADGAVDNVTVVANNLVNGTLLPAVNDVVGVVDGVLDMTLGLVGTTVGLVGGLVGGVVGLADLGLSAAGNVTLG